MKDEKVNIGKLRTVKNYAQDEVVTAQYIYKLEREGRMNLFKIDGVKFVQTDVYPSLDSVVINRR